MTPERWRRVTEVFHAALARDASARASYLDQTCMGDRPLREEVDAMLAAHVESAWVSEIALDASLCHTPRLARGTMIGPYRVADLIGAGGMGEVYRARDTKLGRDVAIKVLPAPSTADAERLLRFEREARLLAALNHPRIAAIYGFEEADGVRALILELVEGDTLADRVGRGSILLDRALPIAQQLAEALDAAHEKGIIHRDLKPANIKITPDGTVKVLDFGLAKTWSGEFAASSDLSASPTVTATAARPGIVMGTPAYMSPEQASGMPVDKRTDIWAFGCVLYEMLTGRRAFEGDDTSHTLAAVLRAEPDWSVLPPQTPAAIRRLLRRCLEKDRKDRQRDIGDVLVDINEALTAPIGDTAAAASSSGRFWRWRRITSLAVGALAVAMVAGAAVWLTLRPPPPRVMRTTLGLSYSATAWLDNAARSVALAPDGTRVVYVGAYGTQLFVRALDRLEATTLSGLGTPRHPFFSPDGQWIGFFDAYNTLKKVATTGGPAVTICPCGGGVGSGATWGADGTIVFAREAAPSGLWRVSADGGEPSLLTKPDREGEARYRWPEFLPGAQAVLFTIAPATGSMDNAEVAVLDVRTGTHKILVRGGSHAHYLPSGHLVYWAAGSLRAVAFDLARLEVVGNPTSAVPQVLATPRGAAEFDVAPDGTLVYLSDGGVQAITRTLVWVDRQGREEPVKAPAREYAYPRLSPDGTRVAVDSQDQESDVFIWPFSRETLTRLTFDPGVDRVPVWTPDGRRLVFASGRSSVGARNLFWQAADGTGAVERLSESLNLQDPAAVSPDGTRIVFEEQFPKTGWDLMVLTLDTPRRTQPLVQTTFDEQDADLSPDGRWLAYEANNSGQHEIYVRPLPNVDSGLWQVSAGGGMNPLWARNGRELFYQAPTGAMMSVQIERGTTWAAGTPSKLFDGRAFIGDGFSARTYDVTPDGQRFLMIKPDAGPPVELFVVQNWSEELKRLVPVD